MLIDGSLGEGKTTLAIHCADKWNRMAGFGPIKFEEQLGMGGREFIKLLPLVYEKHYPCIIYDEAGDFSRRGAMSTQNRNINTIFETFRAYGIIIIFCNPCFNSLDSSIFRHNAIRLLLHCQGRSPHMGTIKGYDIDSIAWLRMNMDKYKYREYEAYNWVPPNFVANFSDLDPARSKLLDEYCTKGKIKILKRAAIKSENMLNLQDIKTATGRSTSWVNQKISDLKIKSVNKIGATLYYDRSAVELLKKIINKSNRLRRN
jgi:hypothetical protein